MLRGRRWCGGNKGQSTKCQGFGKSGAAELSLCKSLSRAGRILPLESKYLIGGGTTALCSTRMLDSFHRLSPVEMLPCLLQYCTSVANHGKLGFLPIPCVFTAKIIYFSTARKEYASFFRLEKLQTRDDPFCSVVSTRAGSRIGIRRCQDEASTSMISAVSVSLADNVPRKPRVVASRPSGTSSAFLKTCTSQNLREAWSL